MFLSVTYKPFTVSSFPSKDAIREHFSEFADFIDMGKSPEGVVSWVKKFHFFHCVDGNLLNISKEIREDLLSSVWGY